MKFLIIINNDLILYYLEIYYMTINACYLCDSRLGKRRDLQLVCVTCGGISHLSCNAMFPKDKLSCCVMCLVKQIPGKVKENTNIKIVQTQE